MTTEIIECPICLEEILGINCTTTECGHKFHSSCIFKNLNNTNVCPICRKEMVSDDSQSENDDDESGSVDSWSTSSDSILSENNEIEPEPVDDVNEERYEKFTVMQISEVLRGKGYTECDLLNYIIHYEYGYDCVHRMSDGRQRKREIMDIIDSVLDNEIEVDHRDSRSYSNVVLQEPRIEQEIGRGPSQIVRVRRRRFIGPLNINNVAR